MIDHMTEQKMKTMNAITPFQFENNSVRVVTDEDGEPLFVASDVCQALAIDNHRNVIARLDDDEKGVHSMDTPGGRQDLSVINESGLYSLIMTSRKPEAKRFRKWVTSEVLPTIRKTGSYTIHQPVAALPIPKDFSEALRLAADLYDQKMIAEQERDTAIATKHLIGSRREATAMSTASTAARKAARLEIELDRAKDYATVKRMEMIYHGQKFNWRPLKDASVNLFIPPIDVFDVNYGTVKAYHAAAWREAYALEIIDDLMAA